MSETTTEELTPALFDHSKRLYDAMLAASHKEVAYDNPEGAVPGAQGTEVDIYEGHLTRLFAELNLPNPYYTKILDVLKAQNCITQLRRGGGVALSRWCLLEPPTEEGFKILTERKRAPKGKVAIIEQRTNDLMKSVSRLEDYIDNLSKSLEEVRDDLATMKRLP